jgi:hypothetical protein
MDMWIDKYKVWSYIKVGENMYIFNLDELNYSTAIPIEPEKVPNRYIKLNKVF